MENFGNKQSNNSYKHLQVNAERVEFGFPESNSVTGLGIVVSPAGYKLDCYWASLCQQITGFIKHRITASIIFTSHSKQRKGIGVLILVRYS